MLKKHQELIKKADELIHHDILEYDKRFTSLYLSDSNIFKDWENHNDDEHFKVCEDIMKRERIHNSILWEAALKWMVERFETITKDYPIDPTVAHVLYWSGAETVSIRVTIRKQFDQCN